jgi:L-serine/L-threonine ammonia-lyase
MRNLALSSCVAQEARSLDLFSTTPLIHSIPLSKLCHPHPVYLKLDLLQRSGSFKDRGMAHLCATVHKVYNANRKMQQKDEAADVSTRLKLISSSGGNAGLAVTTVAQRIPDMDVSVVVPETTKPLVIEKLRSLGAEVTIHGANWNLADALARQWVDEAKEKGVSAVYVRWVQYATHIIINFVGTFFTNFISAFIFAAEN